MIFEFRREHGEGDPEWRIERVGGALHISMGVWCASITYWRENLRLGIPLVIVTKWELEPEHEQALSGR